MTTSSFLAALRANSSLPLVFERSSATIAPGYHLTEVKDASFHTMDCGGMTHRWSETHFELWVPASANERGHMAADKFLRIVNRVEQKVALNGDSEARVFANVGGAVAAVHPVGSVRVHDGRLVVGLEDDRPRCKARERQEAEFAGAGAAETGGCGCGTSAKSANASACCA